MLPLSTLNSVKERGSNGALRSHLFAKRRTCRGGSRRSLSEGGTLNYQLSTLCKYPSCRKQPPARSRSMFFAASPRFRSSDRPNELKLSRGYRERGFACSGSILVTRAQGNKPGSRRLERLFRCFTTTYLLNLPVTCP
jgi:hypothetical protein